MPLVMADAAFLADLAKTEDAIRGLSVVDEPTMVKASALLNGLTTAGARLEGVRITLKRPFLDINNRIDECAKAPAARIDAAKRTLKLQLGAYVEKVEREAAEAEAKRLAEIKRLEEEKAKADAAARAQAEAIAAAAKPAEAIDLAFDDEPAAPKTETELKLEALKFTPAAPVKTTAAGIRFQARLIFQVTEVAKLPEAFVTRTANERLIRDTFCVGFRDGDKVPEIPGIKFTVERTAISTGKS